MFIYILHFYYVVHKIVPFLSFAGGGRLTLFTLSCFLWDNFQRVILLQVVLESSKITYAEDTDFGVILDSDLYLNLPLPLNRLTVMGKLCALSEL